MDIIGKTISHYKILEKLGEGGMGVVYKAEDTKLKRPVALKFLPPELTRDEETKERFIHEAQAVSALDHSNICTIFEIDETEDGQSFIAMAYYEGETLKEKIERGPLKLEEAIAIAIQIAQGLAKAHEQGIVHRDIKPANTMITNDGMVKILDFGLAKLRGQTKLTKEGTTLGTVAYMSPEQARGEEVDHQSDIWSLGIVLYEMITGQLPFKGDYEQSVIYSILNEEPEPLTGLRTGVPLELERMVNKCMEKDAAERYQTAGDLLADLRHLQRITAAPTAQPRLTIPPKAAIQIARRWPWVVALVVVLVIALGMLLRFFAPSKREPISERKMLAVLPFENLGPDEDEYFTDGITEEIMARLASIQGLGVIARTSAIQYKNTDKTIQQIGEELGVDYILEGTVRWQKIPHGPSRVRITPQLIKVVDATHLWANVYEREMIDIFQVQIDIAEQVTKVLDITLLEPERRFLETKPTENLEAYDYYLRGNDYVSRGYEEEDFRIALQMYKKAVESDPNFSLAYARLSIIHSQMYWFFYGRTEECLAKAKEAAKKAFQLNPDLPEAYLALGYYYYWGYLDYDRALEQFSIAQRQQPDNSDLLAAIGFVQRRQGRFEQALNNLKKASKLDPRSTTLSYNVGETFQLLRNYPESERYYSRAISLSPDWHRPYWHKARLYLSWEGSTEKARAVLEKASQSIGLAEQPFIVNVWVLLDILDGNYQEALNRLSLVSLETFETQYYFVPKTQLYAQIYGLINQAELERTYYDSARSILETRVKERPEDARLHSALGIAYAGLGRKQEAIREGHLAVELLPVSREAWRGLYRIEDLARIYVMVGEYDAAIEHLEFLLSIPGELSIPLLRIDPIWDPLCDIPRFQRLLKGGK